MSLLRIWKGWAKLQFSSGATYRFNFILKGIAMLIFGVMGPIAAMIIYSVSSGIPGWSFEEFLLLTGIFLFVNGMDILLFRKLPDRTIDKIREGEYDVDLVKPISPLAFATVTALDLDGITSIFVGGFVVLYSLIKIGWIFNLVNLLSFTFLLALAVLFMYSVDILIASLAFLVVKSYALLDIFGELIGIGRNPLTIYGVTGLMLLTFVFPIGLAAFYPASAILGRIPTTAILYLAATALGFFASALVLWKLAIKKYTSAGG